MKMGLSKGHFFQGSQQKHWEELPPLLLLLLLPPANQMSNSWNLDNAHTHTINRLNPATQLRLVVDPVHSAPHYDRPCCVRDSHG